MKRLVNFLECLLFGHIECLDCGACQMCGKDLRKHVNG